MKLTQLELEFLSAWAREEWEPKCYHLPAHRLQVAHHVPGHWFIKLIKAWTKAEKKKDLEILDVANNPSPVWPWKSHQELQSRIQDAGEPMVTSDLAHRIARIDAEKAYRDLSAYRVLIEQNDDGWHVDYELKNKQLHGGGPLHRRSDWRDSDEAVRTIVFPGAGPDNHFASSLRLPAMSARSAFCGSANFLMPSDINVSSRCCMLTRRSISSSTA